MYTIRSPIGFKNKGHKRPAGEQAPTQDGRQTKAQRLHSPRQLNSTLGGICRRAISATSPCGCNCRRDLHLLRPSARVSFPLPHTPCICSFGAGAGRCSRPHTPCIGSLCAGAGRCPSLHTPCIGSFGAGAGTSRAPSCKHLFSASTSPLPRLSDASLPPRRPPQARWPRVAFFPAGPGADLISERPRRARLSVGAPDMLLSAALVTSPPLRLQCLHARVSVSRRRERVVEYCSCYNTVE